MVYSCVYDASDIVAMWVADKIDDCPRGFGECAAIGVKSSKGLVAGFVFHNWSPECQTIEVSGAGTDPRWAQRSILTELLSYPFFELQCRIVLARTAENNKRPLRMWRALGATEHVLPNLRAEGLNEVVSLLTKEAWQQSRLYDGQK